MSCLTSRRPVVGIIGNSYMINDRYPVHSGGTMNSAAVAEVAGCLPLIIPSDPRFVQVDELLELCDGFLLTGGRPNVHPEEYGEEETPAHGFFDRGRDAVTLPLIRACVERGQPFLGICRGFQEVNVALGGTLHPEIRDLPGRLNHRMPPDGTLEEQFALRHTVSLTPGGVFHRGPCSGRDAGSALCQGRAGVHAVGAMASGVECGGRPCIAPLVRGLRRCGGGLGWAW
jgi:putative glutamine amidotransferase